MPVKITHPPDPVIIMYLSVAPDEELQHQLHIMRIFMVSLLLLVLLLLLLLLVFYCTLSLIQNHSFDINLTEKMEKKREKKSYDSNQH